MILVADPTLFGHHPIKHIICDDLSNIYLWYGLFPS